MSPKIHSKQPTLKELENLARAAGEILRNGYECDHQVSYKGKTDLVTEIDHQSEDYLLSEIRRTYPGHQVISEEAGLVPGSVNGQWYVDPLDGTVNYAHGIPFFSVSIAYGQDGRVLLGAVYDPIRDELFSAELGKGAHLNGRKLHASSATELEKSLLVTGFPYDTWTSPKNNLENFSRFSRLTQGVRRLGSAALDLCYVGAGRLDGYWELTLNPWDVAAGGLIAAEAGARITGLDGSPNYLTPPCSLLAAPPAIYEQMLTLFKE